MAVAKVRRAGLFKLVTGAALVSLIALSMMGGARASTSQQGVEAQAASIDWKKCGETYLFRGLPKVAFSVKRTSCFRGIEVFAHVIVEHNGACSPECRVIDWRCVARSGQGIYCTKGAKRVRAIPIKRN